MATNRDRKGACIEQTHLDDEKSTEFIDMLKYHLRRAVDSYPRYGSFLATYLEFGRTYSYLLTGGFFLW